MGGFGYGQDNSYFRIGLALAFLKVVFPDLGFSKTGFSIRGLFSIRKKGLLFEHTSRPSGVVDVKKQYFSRFLRPLQGSAKSTSKS